MSPHVRSNASKSEVADVAALAVKIADDVATRITAFLGDILTKQAKADSDRSVSAFCRRWSISRFLFYELAKVGKAPRVMVVGGRRLISPAAEAEWVAAREAEAAETPKRIRGKARAVNVTATMETATAAPKRKLRTAAPIIPGKTASAQGP